MPTYKVELSATAAEISAHEFMTFGPRPLPLGFEAEMRAG